MSLALDVRTRSSGTRIAAAGELDVWSVRQLQGAIASAAKKVLIDLNGVRFMDAAGIRAILQAHEHARRCGMTFAVRVQDRVARRLFAKAGIDVGPVDAPQ